MVKNDEKIYQQEIHQPIANKNKVDERNNK